MSQPGHWRKSLVYLRKTAGGETLTNQEMLQMETAAITWLNKRGYSFGDTLLNLVFKKQSDDSYFGGAVILNTDIRLRQLIKEKLEDVDQHWNAIQFNASTKQWVAAKMDQLGLYWEYR